MSTPSQASAFHARIELFQDRLEAMRGIIVLLQEEAKGLAEMTRKGYTGDRETDSSEQLSDLSKLSAQLSNLQNVVWESRYEVQTNLTNLLNTEIKKLLKAADVTWSVDETMGRNPEVHLRHASAGRIGTLHKF
jgi:hypothetical protein